MKIRCIHLYHTRNVLPFIMLAFIPSCAEGACALGSSTSSGVQVCDSDISGSFIGLSGDHILIFPKGGTGTVAGDISYGSGIDSVDMQ